MRRNQTSLTAAGIAISRALESEKPEEARICFDPYARRFAPGWLYFLTAIFVCTGYTELRGPGVMGFLVARDRYIDDVLSEYLGKGLQQLVILGAGYDARAYRFDGLKQGVKVFEIDHPATQEDKLARVKEIFGTVPSHVTYVAVDFNTQSLDQRLFEAGYDPKLKTLFIWQGVTMYLAAAAVDETLHFVTRHSAPGSAIVFDYIYHLVLQGTQKHSEVSNMRRYRFMSGEGLTFGIDEGTVEAFLRERGFNRVLDVSAEDLKQRYFTGRNARRNMVSGYGIAVAEV